MSFENGVRALYQGAKTNAVGLNGWYNESSRTGKPVKVQQLDDARTEVKKQLN